MRKRLHQIATSLLLGWAAMTAAHAQQWVNTPFRVTSLTGQGAIDCIAREAGTNNVLIGASDGVYRTTDGGVSFVRHVKGFINFNWRTTAIWGNGSKYLVGVLANKGYYTDSALNGNFKASTGLPASLTIRGFGMAPNGHVFCGASTAPSPTVHRSLDTGKTWTSVASIGQLASFTHFAVNPVTGVLIAGGAAGTYTSTNAGTSWVAEGLGSLTSIAQEGNLVLRSGVASGATVLRHSTDGGVTFANTALPNLSSGAVLFVAIARGAFVVASALGPTSNNVVYVSEDLGTTWTNITGTISREKVTALNSDGQNIYAVVDFLGTPDVFTIPYSSVLSNIGKLQRSKLQLLSNPVSDKAQLQTALTEPMTYRIMTLAGQVISSGTLSPGEVEIPTQLLKAGTYYLQATVGTATQNLRFVKE